MGLGGVGFGVLGLGGFRAFLQGLRGSDCSMGHFKRGYIRNFMKIRSATP